MPTELLKLTVTDVGAWRTWLARESTSSPGVWLTIAKKPTSTATSLTYAQALDEALCCGWIDSTGHKVDDATGVQRFTPRKPKSIWSQRNVSYIERLEKEGRLQPAGRAVVDAAKADGRWAAAYSCSGNAEPPEDFKAALKRNPDAQATWDGLSKGSRWTIYFTLVNLRTPAGRERRIKGFVEMLARGEAPAPQRQKRKPEAEVADENGGSKKKALKEPAPKAVTKAPSRQTRSGRLAPNYTE